MSCPRHPSYRFISPNRQAHPEDRIEESWEAALAKMPGLEKKNSGGTPKIDGACHGNPIQMDDFGGTLLLRNLQVFKTPLVNDFRPFNGGLNHRFDTFAGFGNSLNYQTCGKIIRKKGFLVDVK